MPIDDNVDRDEIAKFEKLASRWWDPNSEFKPLHDINPLRARWIDEHADVNGKSVLDVGCGGGLLCEALAHRGATVTGIDMGEAPLSVARLHQLESGVEVDYLQSTAEALAEQQQETFEVVTCLEMITLHGHKFLENNHGVLIVFRILAEAVEHGVHFNIPLQYFFIKHPLLIKVADSLLIFNIFRINAELHQSFIFIFCFIYST